LDSINEPSTSDNDIEPEKNLPLKDRIKLLLPAFRNKTIVSWSLWWALASCGTYQVANYAQTLWAPLQREGQFVGNGFVECANTLLCKFQRINASSDFSCLPDLFFAILEVQLATLW
jgi:hypothetical protein